MDVDIVDLVDDDDVLFLNFFFDVCEEDFLFDIEVNIKYICGFFKKLSLCILNNYFFLVIYGLFV